jgi:ELWxxDGT repeat protein
VGSGNSYTSQFTVLGTTLYFSANDGVNGYELWKSDGTTNGTTLDANINAGSNGSEPSEMIVFNNALYFAAEDGLTGRELWRSYGVAMA